MPPTARSTATAGLENRTSSRLRSVLLYDAITAKRITKRGFSVQDTHPAIVAARPRGSVRSVQFHRFPVDCELFVHLVGKNRHIIATESYFNVIADLESMKRVGCRFHH